MLQCLHEVEQSGRIALLEFDCSRGCVAVAGVSCVRAEGQTVLALNRVLSLAAFQVPPLLLPSREFINTLYTVQQ